MGYKESLRELQAEITALKYESSIILLAEKSLDLKSSFYLQSKLCKLGLAPTIYISLLVLARKGKTGNYN